MKKRVASALLCAVLVLSLLPAARAAQAPTEAEAAQVLSALDIMTGNENGDLMLGRAVTRAEFTKLVVAASPLRDNVGPETATDPYPDVPRTHWAAGYVAAAVSAGLVRGNLYGYFEPDRNITLAEGVTMVLRLLGYRDSDFTGAYPAGQMAKYRALGLDTGVPTTASNGELTRRDALYLFYNLLTAKTADSSAYLLDVLKPGEHLVTPSGTINPVALVNAAMEGPVVASGGWQSKLPFDLSTAKVYRGGSSSTLSAVAANDVVYYSKSMRTLWVYSNKVTGSIEAITPASSPTSVNVAGKSYSIETPAAAYDLSDLGPFRVGDSVTLLLGRDNQVAAVLDPVRTSSTVYGMVTAVETASYEDASGNPYTASTLTVQATDGNTYSYRWDQKNLKAGALVQVTTNGGSVQVTRLSGSGISGKVSTDGTRLGSYDLADDVEILDTYGDTQAVRVYPSRLKGVSLRESDVRFYQLDEHGAVRRLILNEVTGDMHRYGVLTHISETDMGMAVSGVYEYDIGGLQQTPITGATLYNVKTGPFQLKQDADGVKLANLNEVTLTSVDGKTAYAGSRTYPLSDTVAVYELRGNTYYYSSLSLVSGGDYTLTGYYDKPADQGGCIRVIVAR